MNLKQAFLSCCVATAALSSSVALADTVNKDANSITSTVSIANRTTERNIDCTFGYIVITRFDAGNPGGTLTGILSAVVVDAAKDSPQRTETLRETCKAAGLKPGF